jgi:hypothetical protein
MRWMGVEGNPSSALPLPVAWCRRPRVHTHVVPVLHTLTVAADACSGGQATADAGVAVVTGESATEAVGQSLTAVTAR